MKRKLACLGFGALLIVAGSAHAENFNYGSSLKDRVPAPIPVPAPMPVAEGFSYYLRADLGWGFTSDRSYTETGRVFGRDTAPFIATGVPFTSSAISGPSGTGNDGSFLGTVGAGVYFSPWLRGDVTLDFRSKQQLDVDSSTYSYTSTTAGTSVSGIVQDRFSLRSTVALANIYFDLLPRGGFSPYIGAGVGIVYNDVSRSYTNIETAVSGVGSTVQTVSGTGSDSNVALAGALMAGATIAWDHRWALDVGYRALYLGGIDVTNTLNSPVASTSKASLGDQWEHQVRIGLRFNIW